MNLRYVLAISIITALGGFLFGFDTAVISGANLYIQSYFDLNELAFGFVVSSMLIGCAFGALFSGIPSQVWGRKKLLMVTALLFIISAVGSALATSAMVFVLFRMIGGLGVGAASMLSPTYIAEISPATVRGKMVSLNQLTIVLGITAAFFSNYFLSGLPDTISWRWMLGVETFPAMMLLVLLIFVPESPRWLIGKNRLTQARKVLVKINGTDDAFVIEQEIREDLASEAGTQPSVFASYQKLLGPVFRRFTLMAIILAILQQVTGINVIMYYAPNIFESIGVGKSSAIFQSVSIGVTMSLFTVLAMVLVDKIGRKKLLKWGALAMALSLFLLGIAFSTQYTNTYLILLLMLCFISAFSLSAGPVTWVLISEILPNEIRSTGISLATFFLWMANYVVTLTFPVLLATFTASLSGITFAIYGICCLILFYYASVKLMETKGKTLEEIKHIKSVSS